MKNDHPPEIFMDEKQVIKSAWPNGEVLKNVILYWDKI